MDVSKREIEYLEAIATLEKSSPRVTLTALAEYLNVSVPSVYEEISHLKEKGYVERSGKAVKLTDKGRDALEQYKKAHRVLELLLVKAGVSPDRACELSAQFDVSVPEEVIEALYKYLGEPKACPHGNPIP
ncbi:MAG: metal-dependent transcriptional regulator [Thermoprotei archaeon]